MRYRTPPVARVAEIDALRGFALFGILMVNVWFFADSAHLSGGPDASTAKPSDLAIRFMVETFFEGKFYLLFSLLFGYGFVVLQGRAGADSVRLIRRRLAFLAVLGFFHGLTLFYGDILLTYAVAGAVLLATRAVPVRTALGAAVAIPAGVALLLIGSAVLLLLGPAGSGPSGALPPVVAGENPIEAFHINAGIYGAILPTVMFFQGPLALAAFYAGSALAALGVLRPQPPARGVLLRVVVLALPLGLAVSACQAYLSVWGGDDATSLLATGLSVAASPLVTAGYAAAILLLLGSRAGRTVTAILGPPGRLSLTNYLAQSAVLCIVFTGYGLGLMDRLPSPLVVVVVVVLFAVQVVASRLILARFHTGPLEWALRSFVSGRGSRNDRD